MSEKDTPIIIKKYANRRLYNTGSSAYVTLEDLADMVKRGDDFVVQDAKSGEDLTRAVLTQIIFEQEGKEGQNLLPVAFLRQLISFYGDSMQTMVPSYLELTMNSFAQDQEKIREQMQSAIEKMGVPGIAMPGLGMNVIEEQVKRNTEMFQNALQMFVPFAGQASTSVQEEKTDPAAKADDIRELKKQLADMQEKLSKLG